MIFTMFPYHIKLIVFSFQFVTTKLLFDTVKSLIKAKHISTETTYWNSYLVDLKRAPSLNTFLRRIKRFFNITAGFESVTVIDLSSVFGSRYHEQKALKSHGLPCAMIYYDIFIHTHTHIYIYINILGIRLHTLRRHRVYTGAFEDLYIFNDGRYFSFAEIISFPAALQIKINKYIYTKGRNRASTWYTRPFL
jgi:hypothetical protein